MSRSICTSLALALALALGAGSAFAQQPAAVSADQSTTPTATTPASETPVIKPGDRSCLRTTGSLIRAKPGHCLPVAGRSYTGDELRNTGRIDTGRALQMLDPSISVNDGY